MNTWFLFTRNNINNSQWETDVKEHQKWNNLGFKDSIDLLLSPNGLNHASYVTKLKSPHTAAVILNWSPNRALT